MSPAAIEVVKRTMRWAGFRGRRPGRAWLVAVAAAVALVALGWNARGPGADRLSRRAQEALRAGRLDDAEADLTQLGLARAPTPPDRMLRAQVAIARGRVDAARGELARIPDRHPMAPHARLYAGQLELRRDRLRAAEESLRAALALDPSQVQAHRELIYIYGMQQRRDELGAQFRALSKLRPLTFDNVLHWCLMGQESWEPDEVTPELGRFVEADPTDRWSRLAWAGSLRRIGRVDEAWRALEALPDTDVEAQALRAQLTLDRGDPEAAEALLEGGAAGHVGLARLRGRLALTRRDGPSAWRDFTEPDAARPGSRDVTLGLAQAWTLLGDEAKARPYLASARRHDTILTLLHRAESASARRDPGLLRELGEACAATGRADEARAWLTLALAHDPLDAEAQRALFRLRDAADRVGTSSPPPRPSAVEPL